jgi:hypothetical protein
MLKRLGLRTWTYILSCVARHWESLLLLGVLILLAETSARLGALHRAASKDWFFVLRLRYLMLLRLQQAALGVFLGLGRLLVERGRHGRWSLDFPRLVIALLAALVALFTPAWPYLHDNGIYSWFFQRPWWVQGTFEASAAALFGFLVITSLRKRGAPANVPPIRHASATAHEANAVK